MGKFLGHSKNGDGAGNPESLLVHVTAVASRASGFMKAWGQDFSGWVIGIFHDLGKYADQMQQRLRQPSVIGGKNHATAGACFIAYRYKNSLPLALSVLYHHGGLKKFFGSRKKLLEWIAKEFHENPEEYTETDLKLVGGSVFF